MGISKVSNSVVHKGFAVGAFEVDLTVVEFHKKFWLVPGNFRQFGVC